MKTNWKMPLYMYMYSLFRILNNQLLETLCSRSRVADYFFTIVLQCITSVILAKHIELASIRP